jgi:succinyl-CoA synthetase beta subunit
MMQGYRDMITNDKTVLTNPDVLNKVQSGMRRTADGLLKSIDPEAKAMGYALHNLRQKVIDAVGKCVVPVVEKEVGEYVIKSANAVTNRSTFIEVLDNVKVYKDNKIIAVDGKVNIDDSALYRHPDYEALRDLAEEDPTEVEAAKHNLNFVKLDGNVGCMVNGAGLAMATMDIIKLSGGDPANFLDVGGSANATTVEAGFRIILQDPNVKAILINIFGGIVRCDRVAQGVVDAYKNMGNIPVPIIVRLQGTNAIEAKKLIDESGLNVHSAVMLQEAADLVKEVLA